MTSILMEAFSEVWGNKSVILNSMWTEETAGGEKVTAKTEADSRAQTEAVYKQQWETSSDAVN